MYLAVINDKKTTKYKLPIDVLRVYRDVSDEFVWQASDTTTGTMKIIRRVGVKPNGDLYLLRKEYVKDLGTMDIYLPEGNGTINFESFPHAILSVTYMKKNKYTKYFSTRAQTKGEIKIASNEINLDVTQKLSGIAGSDGRVTSASVILAINDDESSLKLNADKISLEGKTLALTTDKINIEAANLTIDTEGNIKCNNLEATNGKFSGEVTSSKGTIGGWSIDSSGLSNGNFFIKNNGYSNIYTFADCFIVRNYILGKLELNDDGIKHYDMNSDGKVDISDYAMLIAMVKGER